MLWVDTGRFDPYFSEWLHHRQCNHKSVSNPAVTNIQLELQYKNKQVKNR